MPEVTSQGLVGPAVLSDGVNAALRQGRTGELIAQELHGRFYEQNYRGYVFSDGMGLTSISNATFTVATTDATATPIVGVWNPSTSLVNLVILQASIAVTMTALQATGPGGYSWMISNGNAAISTGTAPLNRKSLVRQGAWGKGMSGVALTAKTNALTTVFGSALGAGAALNIANLQTAAGSTVQLEGATENFDGGLIVPPGSVLALMANTTPVAHSAVSAIVWEEVLL